MSKPFIFPFYAILIFSLIFNVSCSGGGSDDDGMQEQGGAPEWTLGDNEYSGGTSASDTSDPSIDIGVLVVGTTGFDRDNGDFSGSALAISHTLQGAGTYSVVSQEDFTEGRIENPDARLVVISCTVGTLNVDPIASTQYGSTTGGTALATLDSQGRYNFTISSSITMSRTLDLGQGVPNAPDTIGFTMDNVFDFTN